MAIEPEIESLGRSEATAKPDFYSRDILTSYNALRTFEGDFDKAQGQLRAIGSAWLLAGIGATGLLVIQEVNHATNAASGLAPEIAAVLRQVLLFVISLGLTSIWKLDQKVYQNLLHNVFALGYWIEFRYQCVPPTRMMMYNSNYDITDSLGEFYSRPVTLIMACAIVNFAYADVDIVKLAAGLWQWSMPQALIAPNWRPCGIVLLVHVAYWSWTLYQARQWGRLSGLLPKEAEEARARKDPAPRRQPFSIAP